MGQFHPNSRVFVYVYQRVHLTRKVRKAKANDFGDGFRAGSLETLGSIAIWVSSLGENVLILAEVAF